MTILDELDDDYDRADALVHVLIDRATGGPESEEEFSLLREYFVKHSELSELLPSWFRRQRSLNQFWQYIKNKYPSYAERREYLWSEFESLLQHCDAGTVTPAEDDISAALQNLNSDSVERVWRKTLFRLPEDLDGAITVSRTLIESVCKHILDDRNIAYSESKTDLPGLYRLVAKELNLAPDMHSDQVYKQILSGCANVVNGLGAMRNKSGDAHGHGRRHVQPAPRHARLAANLGGTMALYLIETHLKGKVDS